jgi:hypothetical protein
MRHGRLGVRGPGGPLQCLRVQETRPLGVEPRKEGELVLVRYSKGPIGRVIIDTGSSCPRPDWETRCYIVIRC